MASSPLLRHQASSLSLRHQASSPSLRHQASCPSLRHQAWLTTHVRNFEDLIGLICQSEMSSRLDLSIPSGIVEEEKLLTSGARQSLSWSRRSDPRRVISLPWSAKGS